MAQNKYLQLLRNSSFAANYEAAVAMIKANAPAQDGTPIVVRFNEGEGENLKVRALLGVSYKVGETSDVHFVEIGGERIKDVKEALEAAIAAAKKAATTKVENKADDAHIKVTPSEPDTDGAVTYTVEGVDIASEREMDEAISGLTDDIKAINDKIGGEYDAENTVDAAIKAASNKAAVALTTKETANEGYLKTYVLSQGDDELGTIDIPKDLVVTGGEVIVATAENEGLVEGEQYLKLTIANQETPVFIAVTDLVDVYNGSDYIEVASNNTISLKLAAVDNAILNLEGGKVADAIAAAQTAAANVQSALTQHEADFAQFQIENTTAIGDAEAAAKAYASGYTEEKIAGLDAEIAEKEGEFIVSISQVDGIVSATSKAVVASQVNGTYNVKDAEGNDKEVTETVQASIQAIKNELATLNGGVGSIGDQIAGAIAELDATVSGASENAKVTVKVTEVDGKLTAVEVSDSIVVVSADADNAVVAGTDGGAYVSNVWDCGTF